MSNRFFNITALILTFISASLGVATIVPTLRQSARDLVLSHKRVVLGKVEGDLTGKRDHVVIVKVQTADTLSLEIYRHLVGNDDLTFQRRIILPEKRDGYFHYRGEATNLLMADLDQDGGLEVIAPAFDENLIPRLNVFKYDAADDEFVRMNSKSQPF